MPAIPAKLTMEEQTALLIEVLGLLAEAVEAGLEYEQCLRDHKAKGVIR